MHLFFSFGREIFTFVCRLILMSRGKKSLPAEKRVNFAAFRSRGSRHFFNGFFQAKDEGDNRRVSFMPRVSPRMSFRCRSVTFSSTLRYAIDEIFLSRRENIIFFFNRKIFTLAWTLALISRCENSSENASWKASGKSRYIFCSRDSRYFLLCRFLLCRF